MPILVECNLKSPASCEYRIERRLTIMSDSNYPDASHRRFVLCDGGVKCQKCEYKELKHIISERMYEGKKD